MLPQPSLPFPPSSQTCSPSVVHPQPPPPPPPPHPPPPRHRSTLRLQCSPLSLYRPMACSPVAMSRLRQRTLRVERAFSWSCCCLLASCSTTATSPPTPAPLVPCSRSRPQPARPSTSLPLGRPRGRPQVRVLEASVHLLCNQVRRRGDLAFCSLETRHSQLLSPNHRPPLRTLMLSHQWSYSTSRSTALVTTRHMDRGPSSVTSQHRLIVHRPPRWMLTLLRQSSCYNSKSHFIGPATMRLTAHGRCSAISRRRSIVTSANPRCRHPPPP
mmetsp:Transcript_26116/g.42804  ORF Transcript_26116/g.42804 Transcript_26116/m.42804 type:complete len:271 (-) Transcript_26116:733-1545(-)